jgi:2-succinyl-5-enolpyruvyl-6-hydroxy-3-cyclohexene-1-carboxylate synthase
LSDPQSEWAQLLCGSLVEAGVREAIISPGSRSTPLVWAASRTPGLRCHCLIDERSAGFYALGQARISGMPSLLICTSGTALSHYYPAVIEAHAAGTPLIVLSADRPFELQHCGAQQTIDQTRIFGSYASFYELGTPVADRRALLGLRRIAWQAVASAIELPRGAVHLNFRAKKPLEPQHDTPFTELPKTAALLPLRRAAPRAVDQAELESLVAALSSSSCPLLICGALSIQDSPDPELVRRFVELSGSIVCAEAVSQLRFRLAPDGTAGLVCSTYDWLLGSAVLKARLTPDFALQLGAAPVSTGLERLISVSEPGLRYTICAESGWPDPSHQAAQVIRASTSELLEAVCARLIAQKRSQRPARVRLWQDAQRLALATVEEHLRSAFGEAAAVATVCAALPDPSVLAVGNSLPPRLVDRYCPSSARQISVCSQRGAAGIEGAIAGVLGAASVSATATTLLLGDISFLHDVGSLWAAQPDRSHAPPYEHPVVIVVLNNAGGRIFDQLPIATSPGVEMHWWTTPHALQFEAAAALYGIAYSRATKQRELSQALTAAYARPGVTLLEVVVDSDSASGSLRQISSQLEPQFAALLRERAS